MEYILSSVYLFLCFGLIALITIQPSKNHDLSTFISGNKGSEGKKIDFLTKLTIIIAALFIIVNISILSTTTHKEAEYSQIKVETNK